MRRETPPLALLVVAAWLFQVTLSGDYAKYVKTGLRPWLFAASGALALLAVIGLRYALTAESRDVDSSADEHKHRSRVGWLLIGPVVAFALVVPTELGARTATRAAAPPPAPTAAPRLAPLPAGGTVPLSLREFTERALWDSGRSAAGRSVRLVGFVTHAVDGGTYVTRLIITCCAADAMPVVVKVRGPKTSFPDNTWIEVVGVAGPPARDQRYNVDVASITAASVRPTAKPASPYEQ